MEDNYSFLRIDDSNTDAHGFSTDSSGDEELAALLSDDKAQGGEIESSDEKGMPPLAIDGPSSIPLHFADHHQ